MKIIGGKDYYDSALAHGQDTEGAIFKRTHCSRDNFSGGIDPHPDPEFFPNLLLEGGPIVNFHRLDQTCESSSTLDQYNVVGGETKYNLNPVVVWFCGKRYAGVRAQHNDYSKREPGDHGQVFWSAKSLLDFIDVENHQAPPLTKKSKRRATSRQNLERYFESPENAQITNFLIENRISIAVYDRSLASNTWIVDGDVLKYTQFQKVFPPFQAMQELSMYVDGVLTGNTNPIVEITDDKIKIAKHGFDRWTFRKKSANAR